MSCTFPRGCFSEWLICIFHRKKTYVFFTSPKKGLSRPQLNATCTQCWIVSETIAQPVTAPQIPTHIDGKNLAPRKRDQGTGWTPLGIGSSCTRIRFLPCFRPQISQKRVHVQLQSTGKTSSVFIYLYPLVTTNITMENCRLWWIYPLIAWWIFPQLF